MINKKLFTVITFLFLLSCGYQPIYSSKESVFTIEKIELVEKNNINREIKNVLKTYQGKNITERIYDLKISSEKIRVILTKDSKGDPKIFGLNILVDIEIIENNFLKNTKRFKKTIKYNNSTNKFDLKQYEDKSVSNLTNKIIEEIIIYLQSV